MQVTTWNNGSFNESGAGYGVRISSRDREIFFDDRWEHVTVLVDNSSVHFDLKKTFWSTCPELRSKKIGEYLIKNGLERWQKGNPHKLSLSLVEGNTFKLEK